MSETSPEIKAQCADLTERAIEALRTVYDPEIPYNIYDLGLIYTVDVTKDDADKFNVKVDMTLTSVNCPVADTIPIMVRDALQKIEVFDKIDVQLVWDPPWDRTMMSDDARFDLNMF